jgi:D-sedoheptulose 7-phosphate isomerase
MKTVERDERAWLAAYFAQYRTCLFHEDVVAKLIELKELMRAAHAQGEKTILAGNGGSAAIASHCAVDFTKSAGLRCINFNEVDLITCLANDYGYAWWLQKALAFYADDGDLVLLISSSGKSPNMINAARYAKSRGLTVVTFTGFAVDNPLQAIGDLNFWVDSGSYNVVEMTHHIWLLSVCDLIIGSAEPFAKREHPDAVNR